MNKHLSVIVNNKFKVEVMEIDWIIGCGSRLAKLRSNLQSVSLIFPRHNVRYGSPVAEP